MFVNTQPQCNETYGTSADKNSAASSCDLVSGGTGTYVENAPCTRTKCIGTCMTQGGFYLEYYYSGGLRQSAYLKGECEDSGRGTWADNCN
jgi:hypothetical protein